MIALVYEKTFRDLGSGFVGFEFNTYQTSFCWQKTKKETAEPEDITVKLDKLNKLYDDGKLTKKQYEKAKDILLYKNY